MSTGLLHGLPVIVVIALIVLIYRRGANNRATYTLPQPWTHDPILWSAVDEPIPAGGHDHHSHGGSKLTVGGGASGRW